MVLVFILYTFIGHIFTLKMPVTENPNNFGPYEPVWTKHEICKGPKLRNATNTALTLSKYNNDFIGTMDLNFTAQSSIDEVKIMVYSVKDNKKNLMWAYKLTDPCKHFLLANIMEQELNAHNCVVEKAHYHLTPNFTEITKKLIGPSFFYGNYSLKALMLSKKANLLCLIVSLQILKKAV